MRKFASLKKNAPVHLGRNIWKKHMIRAIIISIEETSHSSAMTMKVDDQIDWLFLSYLSYSIFDEESFRLLDRIWSEPASIEVKTCKIASIIPQSNSIDIDHGKNVDIKPPKQKLYFFITFQKLIDHLFPNIRARSLPRMLSA